MIRCCLIPERWPMRTEWLRSILPDNLTWGARAVCGYKLTSCWCYPNRPFTHKVFCCQKVNARHSVSDCVRGIPTVQYAWQMSVFILPKKGWGRSENERDVPPLIPLVPFCRFTIFSISLYPHHIPPDEGARCSPQNLKGCWKSHTNLTHPGKYFRPSKVKIMRPTSPK